MKNRSILPYLFLINSALIFWGCNKVIPEPENEDFNVKTFISSIKSYNINAEFNEDIIPVDTTSSEKPFVSVQSWVIKGKDILISITVPDDAEEIYFGAINSRAEYMGLDFTGQEQKTAKGYYRLELKNIAKSGGKSKGSSNYLVVFSSNENIQVDRFDLTASYKTAAGLSNIESVPMDVINIAPYQKILKAGFRPLTGYSYTIKITNSAGGQVSYSYNQGTGAETFNNSQSPDATLSYDPELDINWIDFADPQFGGYTLTATIQIDLNNSSQTIYLLMAIVSEGKIDQLDLDADIQQTGQNTAVGTVNVGFGYFEELAQKIIITKFWSDQFPDVVANYLPNGAGLEGDATKTITMGASLDLKAHIKAKLSNLPRNKKVSICLIDIDNNIPVQCNYSISNEIVSISAPLDGYKLNNFRIVAGLDKNNNNVLDIDEYQAVSNGKIRVIPQYLYNENVILLSSGSYISNFWPGLIYSPAFILSFIKNEKVNLDGVLKSSISIGNIEKELALDYNIGLVFTSENSGLIGNQIFSSNSSLSQSVASSAVIRKVVNQTLNQNATEVLTYFRENQNNSQSFEWELVQNTVNFYIEESKELLDDDLYYTFGRGALLNARLSIIAQRINGNISVILSHVKGSLIDLYDFNFDNLNNLADRAFYIQAGHGTLGVGGNVFRVEVKLDTDLSNFSYNF